MVALRRKMLDVLDAWRESGSRKAFMLVGARQTGKTFIVRQFADIRFKHLAEVNLLDDAGAGGILAAASSASDFASRLSLVAGCPVVPGETLVFLDEIQEKPDLITAVKFLVEDGSFDVVLSGSMLGTELKGFRSFPVGYVQIERMFPLDFEEFCWAQSVPQGILDDVREAFASRRGLDDALHERLSSLFRYYVAVGGMPEAVSVYVDSSYDMGAVRDVSLQLAEQYRFDIAKYAFGRAPQIRRVFDAVPSQLDKVNKRFRMDALKSGAVFERYADDFAWLVDAAVVLPAHQVTEPKSPLKRTAQPNRFKLYSSDTGLLLSQYAPQTTLDVVANASAVNFGAVYENAVAQALSCCNPDLFYFYSSRKGEVDFLLERCDGSLLPVEVKSGKDYKLHTALNNILGTDDFCVGEACVLSMSNVGRGERAGKTVWYLPLYMAFCLAEQTSRRLGSVRLAPPTF